MISVLDLLQGGKQEASKPVHFFSRNHNGKLLNKAKVIIIFRLFSAFHEWIAGESKLSMFECFDIIYGVPEVLLTIKFEWSMEPPM